MSSSRPIGLFDSGVGGLSVMKEIRRLLPAEDLLYFGDSAHCPYGTKTASFIRERALAISRFLLSRGVKLIVVASNTTSIAALDYIRPLVGVPVVGMEPAVKPATTATRNRRVGVLATGVTLAGERFSSLLERFGNGTAIYTMPCPGLVELVESGSWEGPQAEALLHRYLDGLLAQGVDTVVLGCTHYPFLRPLVEKMVGKEVRVIDTGEAVARQVQRVLEGGELFDPGADRGREYFYTSADPREVERVMRRLWGEDYLVVERISL